MSNPETVVQNAIVARLGCLPGLVVFRNSVGMDKRTKVVYGLGTGSPDLVFMMRRQKARRALGLEPDADTDPARWFAIEVKTPGNKPEPHQAKCHEQWRQSGAFVAVATSPEEAFAAWERAAREVWLVANQFYINGKIYINGEFLCDVFEISIVSAPHARWGTRPQNVKSRQRNNRRQNRRKRRGMCGGRR